MSTKIRACRRFVTTATAVDVLQPADVPAQLGPKQTAPQSDQRGKPRLTGAAAESPHVQQAAVLDRPEQLAL